MRLRLTILTLLLAVTSSAVVAQQYAEDYVISKGTKQSRQVDMIYGVMTGVILPKLSDKQDKLSIDNKAGYGIGMMWGVDLGGLEIVPEFWYTHSNTTLNVVGESDSYDLVGHSIEVPIVFSIPFAESGLRFNVGPTFALMSNTKLKEAGEEDIDFGRTKSTAGYLIGLSLTLYERLILDCRFTGRYVSTDTQWYNSDESYSYRYYDFAVNVGYRF